MCALASGSFHCVLNSRIAVIGVSKLFKIRLPVSEVTSRWIRSGGPGRLREAAHCDVHPP